MAITITEEDQLKDMRLIILDDIEDESKDDYFKYYLKVAKNTYLVRVYPFDYMNMTELPDNIAAEWQTRCAIQLYDNHSNGLDNAIMYSENGLQIQFAKGGISKDLLAELPPPKGKVLYEEKEETSEDETPSDEDNP